MPTQAATFGFFELKEIGPQQEPGHQSGEAEVDGGQGDHELEPIHIVDVLVEQHHAIDRTHINGDADVRGNLRLDLRVHLVRPAGRQR